MEKWEYAYVRSEIRVSSEGKNYGAKLLEELNDMGSKGWELAGVAGTSYDSAAPHYLFVFKRRITP